MDQDKYMGSFGYYGFLFSLLSNNLHSPLTEQRSHHRCAYMFPRNNENVFKVWLLLSLDCSKFWTEVHPRAHFNIWWLEGLRILIQNAYLPYFKSLGVSGKRYQLYSIVMATPWSMKAGIGLLSDSVPLLGYHKQVYIILSSVIGSLALGILAIVSTRVMFAPMAAVLLFMVNFQIATVDLLTEGKYAELMVRRSDTGADLVSFVMGMTGVGALLASVAIGPLTLIPSQFTFGVAFPFALFAIVPSLCGWFPESQLPLRCRGIRYDKLNAHPGIFQLSLAMTVTALVLCAFTLVAPVLEVYVSLATAFFLVILSYHLLPDLLRRANIFLFFNNVLYVPITAAMDYFFTANEMCLPGGPHFSLAYYVSFANVVGAFASILGTVAFQILFQRSNFRVAIAFTNAIKILAIVFDFAIVKRYNLRIGIPDSIFFLFGDAIVYQAAYRIELTPLIVLTSKVCPRGMEASVYSLLVSFQNLGGNVGRSLGFALMTWFDIRTVSPCDFSNLPYVILIARAILPAISFPLILLLIPNANITDDLVGVNEESNLENERALFESLGMGGLSSAQSRENVNSDSGEDNTGDKYESTYYEQSSPRSSVRTSPTCNSEGGELR